MVNYNDTITAQLNAANIDEYTAGVACPGNANRQLVDGIKEWLKKYKKISKSNGLVKRIRTVGTAARQNKKITIGSFVFVIILQIAIIPLICLLVQAVDQSRFTITGMPEFSSAFVEFSGIDDMTQVVGAGNAILSYQEQANMAANGFGIINAGGNGPAYDIGEYLAASKVPDDDAINAALQRPSDQSKLVFAKGSLESGIAEINTATGKKYITSLYTYAERNEEIVVNLFHEQMRVDISGRIGKLIQARLLTESDIRDNMWKKLETFMRNRQDQFSSRTDGRTNSRLTDAMIRNFNWKAMNSVPLIDVMRGIDDADLNTFERGLSGLFQQYTAYVEWNKNAIKQLLVQLPADIDITKYRTSRQNILDNLYTYYLGPIAEYGKTLAINGRDHPITEAMGWKNAMIHYPWGSFATWLTTTASGMKLLTYLGGSNLLGGAVGLTGGGVGLTLLGTAVGAMI